MIVEQGLWVVLAISVFLAVWGSHIVWRILGLKLAFDTAAVALLAFGGMASVEGLRVLSLLVMILGTTLLFSVIIVSYQFFRGRVNE